MNPKKKNKRILDRVISVLLTACIMVTTFSAPISAFAETVDSVSSDISSSEVDVISGDAVEVTEDESSSDASSDSSSDSSSNSATDSSSEDTSTSDSEADSENGVADSSNSDSVSETETTESDSVSSESDDTSSTGESSGSDSEASSSSDESSSSEEIGSDSSDNSSSDSSSSEEQADSSSSNDESSSDSEESSSATEDDASSDVDSESESVESTETDSENTESEEETIEEEFVAVGIIAPETDVITAEIGSEVTFTSKLNRDDVEVSYQWQRIQNEPIGITSSTTIYDYSDGAPTRYSFVLDDTTESKYLENYPDATWRGIEMYYAIMAALDEIGEDSSNISIEWNTPNYILNGYTISAARMGDHVEVYAEKDGQRHVGTINSEGKWSFGDAQEYTSDWQNIEGATSDTYTFTVGYNDYSFLYRCVVTVLDEEYKEACKAILEEQGVTLTEEQLAAEQKLYSPSITIKGTQLVEEVQIATFATGDSAAVGNPQLSDDVQWITGLTTSYEYITKDTYDRITAWVNEASGEEKKTRQILADMSWTLLQKGSDKYYYAPIMDVNGLPTTIDGAAQKTTREYIGFDLTDGMLEVNSNWYGKTVYFRVNVDGADNWSNTGVAIEIPAYTELTKDADGNYIEAASGTRYKKAITLLNPFVLDTGSIYKYFLELGYISTSSSYSKGKGWILDDGGNVTDHHITVYDVSCEKFNADPEKFMVDAEGNYRMDSVAWGVCTYEEPDISGKAYWVLKDYIANGYGFLVGHDTLYAYAGAYYDAFGIDLDESTIDPNDGTTWYYDINSWMPGTTGSTYEWDADGNVVAVIGRSPNRGGHFYLNELIGSNAGNVDSGTVEPSDAPGNILSGGGSHGIHGKKLMYGGTSLEIVQTAYSAELAVSNSRYRTPTNYPFAFTTGQVFNAAETHTNQQIAFGTVWVNYAENTVADLYGTYKDEKLFTIAKSTGTDNFYLTGIGNFLMNQVGHLPTQVLSTGEAKLFANSVFYVSQRKQCEICAANQDGQQTVHFVHRINSANADEILTALSNGGNYWYGLDDCYMLTDDITLPEDWTAIKNFSGHWNSDVYKVTLNSKGTPLLDNTETPAEKYNTGSDSSWNLGADQTAGVENVFKTDGTGTRTTGVARVLGDLNDLFETNTNYAGYTVKILGSDNPKYLPAGAEYTCTVNTDSKYVISNLPCIYDSSTHEGVLRARVYDTSGNEITDYGIIRTRVQKEFWDNDMTTPLYLAEFAAFAIPDKVTYEGQNATFVEGGVYWHEKVTDIQWQVRKGSGNWINIESISEMQGHYTIEEPVFHADSDEPYTTVSLALSDCYTTWSDWNFRAVFTNNGKIVDTYSVGVNGKYGKLTVNPWALKVTQAYSQDVWVGETTTFTSTAEYWKGIDDGLKVDWEFRLDKTSGTSWQSLSEAGLFLDDGEPTVESVSTTLDVYDKIADEYGFADISAYKTTTTITIKDCDLNFHGFQFRAHYSYTSPSGEIYDWYSNVADNVTYKWDIDVSAYEANTGAAEADREGVLTVKPANIAVILQKAADEDGSKDHQDDITPDEYGQKAFIEDDADYSSDTVTYTAIVYYRPTSDIMTVTPKWQYKTYLNSTAKDWNDTVAKSMDSRMSVTITNTDLTLKEGDKYYNEDYDGWSAIKSVMTITNSPGSMYDTASMTKYFFRCYATGAIDTSMGERTVNGSSRYGGLVQDYNLALNHMGVNTYQSKNIINDKEVTDMTGIGEATKDKDYSVWQYPNLRLVDPKTINTVMVSFNSSSYDSRDSISYDTSLATNYGITVSGDNKGYTFTATTKDSITTAQWQEFLRAIKFTTYDPLTFTSSGTTSGVEILWYATENRIDSSIYISPVNGHYYKYVTSNTALTWNQASANAAALYNDTTGTYGYLATITSEEEWNFVYNTVVGGNGDGWLGAKRDSDMQWSWQDGTDEDTDSAFYSQGTYDPNATFYIVKNGRFTDDVGGGQKWLFFADKGSQVNFGSNYIELRGPDRQVWTNGTGYGSVNRVPSSKYSTLYIDGQVPQVYNYSATASGAGVGLHSYAWNGGEVSGLSMTFPAYSRQTKSINISNCTTDYYFGFNAAGQGDANATPVGTTYFRLYNVYMKGYSSDLGGSLLWGFENFNEKVEPNAASINGVKEDRLHFKADGSWEDLCNDGGNQDVYSYVVEWDGDSDSGAITTTNRSVSDSDIIGTQSSVVVGDGEAVEITVKVNDVSKTYDGAELMPTIEVTSSSSLTNPEQFVKATYTCKTPTAEYTDTTLSASATSGNKVINSGRYIVTLALTDEAIAKGYTLSSESDNIGNLTIYKRPINLYSNDNNKVYDGLADGVIENIAIEAATATSGVVSGDNVTLTTTTVVGEYHDGIMGLIHTGEDLPMKRTGELELATNPYSNYYIASETYTGNITPRPLHIHSLYQDTDTENNPRNIKAYDGTADAVVENIIIDNIVEGDNVWVDADSYKGTYADKNAGESLTDDGKLQEDRYNKLVENKITLTDEVELINNDRGDYYINTQEYSGAIYRETLDARVKSWRGIYGTGMKEAPWHDTVAYKAGQVASLGCWLSLSGLVDGEELTLDYAKSNFAVKDVADSNMTITASTPVGIYSLTYEGLNETNYDILKNYIVSVFTGSLTVEPREIVIEVNDTDKMVGEENPPFYSTFYIRANDDSLVEVGSDETSAYADMKLIVDTDTVANSILVRPHGEDTTTTLSKVNGVSNISYITDCVKDSPVQYLNLTGLAKQPTEACEWCENYHGFELGTDHWQIAGYEVKINHDPAVASTLEAAYVTNPLGEQVQNYTLSYVSGALLVHPELRFQLKATVPLVVCMYGYNGDGEVVEPTNYGITNYSNGAIKVTDIEVSNDGWILASDTRDLKAGELYMKMNDTVLKSGHNKPYFLENWVVGKGDVDKGEGKFLNIPLTCYIAGGNVNDAVDTYVTQVTYTIAEHEKTLPEINE